tara:strand:+ start:4090 stop:4380 length:291 start_codon:yes stop_codon:yes gene_type:complete
MSFTNIWLIHQRDSLSEVNLERFWEDVFPQETSAYEACNVIAIPFNKVDFSRFSILVDERTNARPNILLDVPTKAQRNYLWHFAISSRQLLRDIDV